LHQANDCDFATRLDGVGKLREVRRRTHADAEDRRDAAIDEYASTPPPGSSRFTAATTVSELDQGYGVRAELVGSEVAVS